MPVGVCPRGPRCQQWRLLGLLGLAVLHHRFTCTHTHTGRNRPDRPTDGLTGGTYRAIRTPFLIRASREASLQAALSPDYVVSNIRYLLRCFEPACIYAGNCRFRSLSSLRPSRLRFAPAATPLITSGHRETTAAASARAACRASGASRAGLWRPLTGRRSAAAAPGAACFRRRDLSGLSTRVGSGGG